LQDALVSLGAERQADGHHRLKKPQGAKGRDAMFDISRMPLLLMRAYKR
jgi:hypothetical protein